MAVVPRPSSRRVNGRPVMRFQVRWNYEGVQGPGRGQSKTLDNKQDAQALNKALKGLGWKMRDTDPDLLTLIGVRAEPQPSKGEGKTLADAYREWIDLPGNKRSEGSRTEYRREIGRLGDAGDVFLTSLGRGDLNALFRALETRYAPNTVAAMYSHMRSVLRRYDRLDLLVDMEKAYKATTRLEPIYLSAEEVDLLVEAASAVDAGFGLFVRFVATTGLRLGEALGLQARHIDADNSCVYVRQSLPKQTRRSWGFTPGNLKTEHSSRTVPLWRPLDKVVTHHVEPMQPSEVVFKPPHAGFWVPASMDRKFRHLCQRTEGIPDDLRIHDLRHTAAKAMLDAGVPISTVSRILGHSNIQITVRIYGGFDNRSLDLARLVMER